VQTLVPLPPKVEPAPCVLQQDGERVSWMLMPSLLELCASLLKLCRR